MDHVEALRELGLPPGARWEEVRAAYRAMIRDAHPDVAGQGTAARAARVNAAYTALARARREGRPLPGPGPPAPPFPGRWPRQGSQRPPAGPAEAIDGGAIRLPVPPEEALARLLDACSQIGEVTYVDHSCAIMETVVLLDGVGACSLLVSLHGRPSGGTEAICTLEALERVDRPPAHHVVAALVEALRRPGRLA